MEKIQLDIIGLQSSQSQSGSFALVLSERDGERRLPIIIGMAEAQAIAIEMENIIPNRPMTHDLFKSFGHEFGFKVEEIVISDLKDGVFFAKIVCSSNIGIVEIDARPSDAIAIGLRFKAEIFTYEKILSEAGIVLSEEDEVEELQIPPQQEKESIEQEKGSGFKGMSLERLQKMLEKAIEEEDYERAARLRDEIESRN